MGAKNGSKDNAVKGKDVAAVHLNTFCINKKFIGLDESAGGQDSESRREAAGQIASFWKQGEI